MGRPSQGRTARLQATITPELMAWMEERRGAQTLSDLVFSLLQERMRSSEGKGKKAMTWSNEEQAYFGRTSDGRDIRVECVEYAESQQDGGDDELLNDPDAWASLAGDNQNVTIVKK